MEILKHFDQNRDFQKISNKIEIFRKFRKKIKIFENFVPIPDLRENSTNNEIFTKISNQIEFFFSKISTKIGIFLKFRTKSRFFQKKNRPKSACSNIFDQNPDLSKILTEIKIFENLDRN